MPFDRALAALKHRVVRSRWYTNRSGTYLGCVRSCGDPEVPVLTGRGFMIDYSVTPTTPDQARIEDVLETLVSSSTSILHVGVGNSRLAERFGPRVARIDGLTVSENELAVAEASAAPGYRVVLVNKYDACGRSELAGPYDVIVDNNLTSFGCCRDHVDELFGAYAALLAPGGCILTDRAGMAWTVGDPRWSITPADLRALGAPHGLGVDPVTDLVLALRPTT